MLLNYVRSLQTDDKRQRIPYGAVVAFGFALFTKESAVFYLLLLPFLDLSLQQRALREPALGLRESV